MEKDYDADACARLVGAVVLNCMERPLVGNIGTGDPISRARIRMARLKKIKAIRIKFADSALCKAWCDISNFDHSRIKKLIIETNKKDDFLLAKDIDILLAHKKAWLLTR